MSAGGLTLTTRRLILRPRAHADLDACLAMNTEPGTLDHIDFPREGVRDSEENHRAYILWTHQTPCPPGMGYFTITPREAPGRFLGWGLLAPDSLTGPDIEIGWRLTTAARGRGLATEAARALIAHGFGTLGLDRIVADMHRANAASMGVARKLGMRQVPRPDVTDERHVLWEVTRAMYEATGP